MKKIASLLLCMVLVLSMLCPGAAAAENACMEAGVTVADDGTVTVVVTAKQTAANARLNVTFDSDYLTYEGYETTFAVHSVRAEEEKLTIGLANASANAVDPGKQLVKLRFAMTGRWDQTELTVTAEVYGGRKVSESVGLTVTGEGYRFKDVSAGQWYYEAVDYMASEGYIQGVSDDHYAPGQDMNRASFVTLLGRLEGVEETQEQTIFTDVPVNSYYSGYVAWAVEKGITDGITENLFGPNESVSRAQMVTFLYRYAASEGMDVTVTDPNAVLARFPDGADVPNWAQKPFAWAVENGIIDGTDAGLLPNGISSRAQVAVMLYRFFFERLEGGC